MKPDRRAIARLPVSIETWEIDLVDSPVSIDGVDIEGMLLVVEAASGLVRSAGPLVRGDKLAESLLQALLDPAPPASPARPRVVHCRGPSMRARVSTALKGFGVEVRDVAELPSFDHAIEALFDALRSGPPMPGITSDVEDWRRALHRLVALAPWSHICDSVTFRFEGGPPGLAGSIAIVIGLAGEQEGVILFPSEVAYAQFLEGIHPKTEGPPTSTVATCLYLHDADEIDERPRQACADLGLVLPGNRLPDVVALEAGRMLPLDRAGQRRLLGAIEALCGLCEVDPEELEHVRRKGRVSTSRGEIVVRSAPVPLEGDDFEQHEAIPLAQAYSHSLMLTKMSDGTPGSTLLPTVIVKLAKRDAEHLAAILADVDRIALVDDGECATIFVRSGDAAPQILARLPSGNPRRSLSASPRAWLVVSAGGAKRTSLHPRDFVLFRSVAVDASPGGAASKNRAPSARRDHDTVFDLPIDAWPKASETLLRFVEPLLPDAELPTRTHLDKALEMGLVVWNAVVTSDFSGDDRFVREVQGLIQPNPTGAIIRALIERKRGRFGGDPRLFELAGIDVRQGVPFVRVNTRLPDGFSVR